MDPKISQILDIIVGQWALAILCVLNQNGPTRFNELKRRLGNVTPKVLTTRLRELENKKVIIRTVIHGKIPEVTYAISVNGKNLIPLLETLYQVSEQWETVSSAETQVLYNMIETYATKE